MQISDPRGTELITTSLGHKFMPRDMSITLSPEQGIEMELQEQVRAVVSPLLVQGQTQTGTKDN